MKRIIIAIDDDGRPTIETSGFSGPACEKETEALEAAYGGRGKRTRKPEYFHRAGATERQKAGQS